MSSQSSSSSLRSWAQLVRLPNVFTVLADVGAAFLLVAYGPQPIGRFVCIILSGVSLYWAGMILNDVFDIDRDREERPTRPIPAGDISLGAAKNAGWSLLAIGILLAFVSGYLPSTTHPSTWLPGAIALALAIMIVAYDGPLKKTLLAPAAMGSCRVLSFLLGAAPCLPIPGSDTLFPQYLLGIAAGFGVYIMGITTMARKEAVGGRSPNLLTGYLVTMVGLALLAFAPSMAKGNFQWWINPDKQFPLLIGLIACPTLLRGLRLQVEPTPTNIQNAIRAGILSIIPLAASFAFLGAGKMWGLITFALVVPAIVLAMRLRVT